MLVNSGFPHAKEFFRRLATVCVRALKQVSQPLLGRKISKNVGLKWRKMNALPAAPTRLGPALTLNIETKPVCDVTSFFIHRENQFEFHPSELGLFRFKY